MEAIRTTMNSARLAPILDLPLTLLDREVEVIILPSGAATGSKKTDNDDSPVESIKGILKQYANPALRELEEGAWERAAVEKYLEKMKNDCS